jgi:hypothetical protein
MSKAGSLPPWEVIPPWGKRGPVQVPVVQRVRFAHLENTFLPPLPPPAPEPVSAPPQQPASVASNAHRRAVSLPRNPRPVRPKVQNSPRPIDASPQATNDPFPVSAADPIPPQLPDSSQTTRTRSRSSTLPGTTAASPTSGPLLSHNTSYPSPPSSNKPLISSRQQLENIREDNTLPSNKSLPPTPQLDAFPTNDTTNIPPTRKSRFHALKRSLSLKTLPQISNGRPSPSALSPSTRYSNPSTPDLPTNWADTVVPSLPLTSREKPSKRLASPSYNEKIFAWIETKGSRVVAIGDNEKEISEYITPTPRTPKTLTLPSPKADINTSKSPNEYTKQKSRRLASPGYIKDKFSLAEFVGNRVVNKAGDLVSGGRTSGIRAEDTKANTKPVSDKSENQSTPGNPDVIAFDILDMYDEEKALPSPKPKPPPKDPTAGPKLIPLKYASAPSPKEKRPAPTAPPVPKLIPLNFPSPPSPVESEDESVFYQYDEPIDDLPRDITLEVAPLRIKSIETTPTSLRSRQDTPTSSRSPTSTSGSPQAPSSLATHLITHATPRKLYNATHGSFLRLCANGKVSLPLLSRYLTQERIFLQSYLRFLSLLLANVSVPPKPTYQSSHSPSQLNTLKADGNINARLTSHLITQLSQTQSRLSLFSSLSNDHADLDLESWEQGTDDGMSDATRMLVRLFDVIGAAVERGEKTALCGVLVLWVREKVCC